MKRRAIQRVLYMLVALSVAFVLMSARAARKAATPIRQEGKPLNGEVRHPVITRTIHAKPPTQHQHRIRQTESDAWEVTEPCQSSDDTIPWTDESARKALLESQPNLRLKKNSVPEMEMVPVKECMWVFYTE
jgi:hypothetical protein